MWNTDELQGKAKQLEGTVKEKFGHLTNDVELENEGIKETAAGKVQESVGQVRHKIERAIGKVENILKGK